MEKRAHMRLRFSGPKEHGLDQLGGIHDLHSEGLIPLRGLRPHDFAPDCK